MTGFKCCALDTSQDPSNVGYYTSFLGFWKKSVCALLSNIHRVSKVPTTILKCVVKSFLVAASSHWRKCSMLLMIPLLIMYRILYAIANPILVVFWSQHTKSPRPIIWCQETIKIIKISQEYLKFQGRYQLLRVQTCSKTPDSQLYTNSGVLIREAQEAVKCSRHKMHYIIAYHNPHSGAKWDHISKSTRYSQSNHYSLKVACRDIFKCAKEVLKVKGA